MARILRFDVFGRLVEVERRGDSWAATFPGVDGASREARGITIPPWLEEADILRWLADTFHEAATPSRPDVIRLADRETRVRP